MSRLITVKKVFLEKKKKQDISASLMAETTIVLPSRERAGRLTKKNTVIALLKREGKGMRGGGRAYLGDCPTF